MKKPRKQQPYTPTKRKAGLFYEMQRAWRRGYLFDVLKSHRGNRSHAARTLGLQRTYLIRLLRDLNIHVDPPTRESYEVRPKKERASA